MKASDLPTKVALPFASGQNGQANMRTVPVPSQIGIVDGAASFTDGFPPVCFQLIGAGGRPPAGPDFQYLFNLMTAWARWQAAAGLTPYDGAFSSQIGGYPKGATVLSAVTPGRVWVSTADSNITNPDGSGAANWLALMLASDVLALVTASGEVPIILPSPTLFVRPDGNDTNNGSINTPSGAFATIAAAAAYGINNYYLAGKTLTIQLGASGSYSAPGNVNAGGATISIIGDPNNQSAYNIQGAGPTAGGSGLIAATNGLVNAVGLTLTNTGTINNHLAGAGAGSVSASSVAFASTVAGSQSLIFLNGGAYGTVFGGCIFGASAYAMWNVGSNSTLAMAAPIAMANTPTFSGATVVATSNGVVGAGSGITGSGAVGQRFSATTGGRILTNGSGLNYFPGNAAGSYDAVSTYA